MHSSGAAFSICVCISDAVCRLFRPSREQLGVGFLDELLVARCECLQVFAESRLDHADNELLGLVDTAEPHLKPV